MAVNVTTQRTVGSDPMPSGEACPTAANCQAERPWQRRGLTWWLVLLLFPWWNSCWVLAAEPVRRPALSEQGQDHVGLPFPDYVTGDECLFCHRKTGSTWSENRHNQTVRRLEGSEKLAALFPQELLAQATHIMGHRRTTRILKRSKHYGKLEILATAASDQPTKPSAKRVQITTETQQRATKASARMGWDTATFGDACAGCHATAVDSKSQAFSSLAIDCVACHGVVDLAHTRKQSSVFLGSQLKEPLDVISICGQCHLRGGTSKSTAAPYPNTFVAGDNLFRDFQVNLSDAHIRTLDPAERHVWESVQQVVEAKTSVTCLSCHDVHAGQTDKHQALPVTQFCYTCHQRGNQLGPLTRAFHRSRAPHGHNTTCKY